MTKSASEQVSRVCLSLPSATREVVEGESHLIFRASRKTFAYYLYDHHGDGETAVCCKAEPGMNEMMVERDSRRFFLPAYLGHRGWISMRLDTADPDWGEVSDLIIESFRLTVPRTLVRQLDVTL